MIPPKTLPPSARVGFTVSKCCHSDHLLTCLVTDPWLAYAPVKNNPDDDAAKVLHKFINTIFQGVPNTSGETAVYRSNSVILRKAGIKIDDPVLKVFNGQEVEVWSRVVWKPKWAVTFSDVKKKVKGNNNSVS
uniref:Uncharacterized protein n=1 Tax=Lactuca sativa TaxID=4236 RepID=A0A9R1V9T4_LACSA|nr:hypothetical protein LSAT_V11C600315420 [Lactuca sativa]